MHDDDERRSFDRRREDQELALWRGGIEARVIAVERHVDQLLATMTTTDRTVTRLDGRMDTFRMELSESRQEVRAAAAQIDRGREDAVTKLEQVINDRDQEASAWKLTKFQVLVGALLALPIAAVPTILTLAITGQLH